ncbi:hypothetical protein [Streptomyces sp. NPDC058665]|uniref:hypothetical protein n=1 Tax=Streptomyces sp. NPDC058665 TaxID=3346586 RepID=UPI003669E22F
MITQRELRIWALEFSSRLKNSHQPEDWAAAVAGEQHLLRPFLLALSNHPKLVALVWLILDLGEETDHGQSSRQYATQFLDETFAEIVVRWPSPAPTRIPQQIPLSKLPLPQYTPLNKLPISQHIPLRPGREPAFVFLDGLLHQGQEETVRALYRRMHNRAVDSVTECVRHSKNLAEWQENMRMQLLALHALSVVLVTNRYADAPAGTRAPWSVALAERLFTPVELVDMRRAEAYTEEQYAHLMTAVTDGSTTQSGLDELIRQYRRAAAEFRLRTGGRPLDGLDELSSRYRRVAAEFIRLRTGGQSQLPSVAQSRQDRYEAEAKRLFHMRKELRTMRGRYLVPPYLVGELDSILRNASTTEGDKNVG